MATFPVHVRRKRMIFRTDRMLISIATCDAGPGGVLVRTRDIVSADWANVGRPHADKSMPSNTGTSARSESSPAFRRGGRYRPGKEAFRCRESWVTTNWGVQSVDAVRLDRVYVAHVPRERW